MYTLFYRTISFLFYFDFIAFYDHCILIGFLFLYHFYCTLVLFPLLF